MAGAVVLFVATVVSAVILWPHVHNLWHGVLLSPLCFIPALGWAVLFATNARMQEWSARECFGRTGYWFCVVSMGLGFACVAFAVSKPYVILGLGACGPMVGFISKKLVYPELGIAKFSPSL